MEHRFTYLSICSYVLVFISFAMQSYDRLLCVPYHSYCVTVRDIHSSRVIFSLSLINKQQNGCDHKLSRANHVHCLHVFTATSSLGLLSFLYCVLLLPVLGPCLCLDLTENCANFQTFGDLHEN